MLDRSDASISEVYEQNNSKKSKRNKENSNRSKKINKKDQKDSNQLKSNNSAKVDRSVLEEIITKTKQYLTVANETSSKEDTNFLRKNKKVQKV